MLNLLGLADLDSLCTGEHLPDTTTEDFLWSSLWFIHWSQALASVHQIYIGGGSSDLDVDRPPVGGPSFGKSSSAYSPAASFLPSSSLGLYRGASVGASGGRIGASGHGASPARNESYSATERLRNKSLPKIYRYCDAVFSGYT